MTELSPRAARLFRAGRFGLGLVQPLVPAWRREEWRREWESELWHRLAEEERDRPDQRGVALDLARRLIGALPHALWMRREEWRLDMIGQDLLYAWRALRKRPGFMSLVVGTLALGIGANTAMFTIVNSVLLQPLPFPDAGQLVSMNGSFNKSDQASISPPDFLDYRSGNTVFSSFAGRVAGTAMLSGSGEPERVDSWLVTSNLFSTLGVAPLLGRGFLAEEEQGDGHDVVVLSAGLWKRRFGGDPAVIGKTLVVNGRSSTVVGVMPPVLDQTLEVQLFRPMPFGTGEFEVRRFHFMRAIGRLKPGVTIPEAQAAMDVIAARLASTYPENETWKLRLRSYRDVMVGNVGTALIVLLGAVGLVLLIACGNVASLQLARASSRQGEMALRTALGASRTRIIRQLLTESLLLAAAGGAGGLALAWLVVRGVRVAAVGILPRLAELRIDPTVLVFTAALSLLTGIVFGLAPAIHAARTDLVRSLSSIGRGAARPGGRARDVLVAGQVALSLVLLISAGLLVVSLWRLQHVDPGFEARGVVTGQVSLPGARYQNAEARTRFVNALTERVRAIPGVVNASATTSLPLVGFGDTYFFVEGHPPATDADRRNAMINVVADQYFETMRIGLTTGRTFGAAERSGGPNAIILNRSLAERLFGNESAIGKRLVVDFGKPYTGDIVGVVADVRSYGFNQDPPGTLYFSANQPGWFGMGNFSLVVRGPGDALQLVGPMRAALAELDRDIPLIQPQAMDEVVSGSMSQQRFGARLLGGFALSALLLAVVGLYGVLAYLVSQRTRELGIRLALGARRGQVFGLVVWRGMVLVALGIGVGLAAALGATRLVRGMLFEVGPTDPLVFAVVTLALGAAGLGACLVPARRATRVDPVVALKAEQ